MGLFGSDDVAFKEQNYDELKKAALESGNSFVDTTFPAKEESLFRSKRDFGVEWKRPNVRSLPFY